MEIPIEIKWIYVYYLYVGTILTIFNRGINFLILNSMFVVWQGKGKLNNSSSTKRNTTNSINFMIWYKISNWFCYLGKWLVADIYILWFECQIQWQTFNYHLASIQDLLLLFHLHCFILNSINSLICSLIQSVIEPLFSNSEFNDISSCLLDLVDSKGNEWVTLALLLLMMMINLFDWMKSHIN